MLSSFHPSRSLAVTFRSSGVFVFYGCVTGYYESKWFKPILFFFFFTIRVSMDQESGCFTGSSFQRLTWGLESFPSPHGG